MENLSRLLYVSTAASIITDDDLHQILESSRKNNEKNGVTGVLCTSGKHFVQVLEGDGNSLIRLYGKILEDKRHHSCVLIGLAPISGRIFNQWSMGYIQKSQADIQIEREELLNYRQQKEDDGELIRIMKRFLDRLKPV